MIVDAEEVDDAVDDEQAVLARHEVLHQVAQEVMLELAIVRARHGDVVIGHLRVDAEALGDLCDAFGAEGAFGV